MNGHITTLNSFTSVQVRFCCQENSNGIGFYCDISYEKCFKFLEPSNFGAVHRFCGLILNTFLVFLTIL